MTPLRKSGKNYRVNRTSPNIEKRPESRKKSTYGFIFSDNLDDWMHSPRIQSTRDTKFSF